MREPDHEASLGNTDKTRYPNFATRTTAPTGVVSFSWSLARQHPACSLEIPFQMDQIGLCSNPFVLGQLIILALEILHVQVKIGVLAIGIQFR